MDKVSLPFGSSREAIEFIAKQYHNKKIKVLLVQPNGKGAVKSLFPQVSDENDGIGCKPPIGLLSIATTIKKNTQHDVMVLDCIAEKLSEKDVLIRIKNFNPDIVGISAWTDFWYSSYKLAEYIKCNFKNIHIVLGGPHVSIYPNETLAIPFVDSVVVGDGEIPMLFLCNMVSLSRFDDNVTGLHFKNFGVKEGSKKIYVLEDMDILPMIDRTFLPLGLYTSVVAKEEKITTMITSRGCPFKCVYCKLHFQKPVRSSARRVVEEFKAIARLGVKEIEIYDDTFTWSKSRVIEICDALIKDGVNVRWSIRDRVNNVDENLIIKLYEAGCRRVHYGIESGSDRVLRLIKKNITTEQARNAVFIAKKRKMEVLTFFMIGNLDETYEEMKMTIDFAIDLDADYSTFSITIPYPGTSLYKEALVRKVIPYDFWYKFVLSPVKDFEMPYLIENVVDREGLIKLRDDGVKRFYFRPKFIVRSFFKLRSFRELIKKTKMALDLFRQVWLNKD